jgi:hypothetical protein
MDYFKFCLLDVDKHDLRQKLKRDYELSLVVDAHQEKSIYDKNNSNTSEAKLEFDDFNLPKNKEMNKFLQVV